MDTLNDFKELLKRNDGNYFIEMVFEKHNTMSVIKSKGNTVFYSSARPSFSVFDNSIDNKLNNEAIIKIVNEYLSINLNFTFKTYKFINSTDLCNQLLEDNSKSVFEFFNKHTSLVDSLLNN